MIDRLKSIKVLRYIAAGGTAAAVNLLLLYIFTEFFHIWYVISASLAFLIAFGVSFILQKFWTFKDGSLRRVRLQLVLYFAIALANLAINAALIYLLVEFARLYHILAQIITNALIALESFFVYRNLIFKEQFVSEVLP